MHGRALFRGRSISASLLVGILLLTGCTSGGTRFTLSPETQTLIPAAKELRRASPEPWPLPRELDKQVLAAYIVEPGDVLLVQPVNLDSPVRLPADQPVLPDGTINLGQYGHLMVAGLTVPDIERQVRATIEAKTNDAGPMSVRLISRQSKVYYVLGEVNAPGSFPLAGRETVLDAIVAAGGLTDRASRTNIILGRPTRPDGCRIVLPICYSEIVQLGDTSTNYQMAPGDRIFVASRSFWEGLWPSEKKTCPPCGGPQTPCLPTADGKGCFPPVAPVVTQPPPAVLEGSPRP